MRIYIVLIALILFTSSINAQTEPKLDDFGRIVLNTYLPEQSNLTSEARNYLTTKLAQIATNYGMSGSELNPRFIISASINIGSKDIIAGPPQMIAQNIELTLFVGDAMENKVFSNTILNLKGVGTNENKALINAIKKINPKKKELSIFINEAKSKIITYYNTQCDFILKDALALRKLGNYNEAIYKLSIVPNVCQECYFRSLDTLSIIYQQKIDEDCEILLQRAKTTWAGSQKNEGAEKVGEILRQIHPGASCQNEVDVFIQSVSEKLDAIAKVEWEFKMKQYEDQIEREIELLRMRDEQNQRNFELAKEDQRQDGIQAVRNFELDKIRTNAYNEIALEYAKNQPKTIYNNINWK